MRKFTVSVLMMTLLLLPGCGPREARPAQRFETFRRALLDGAGISARAVLTVDYGGTVAGYAMDLTWDGSETVMEITEPALIAGTRITARWGEGTMAYGDVMLGAGPIDSEGRNTVSAVPAILEAMAGGHGELFWREGDMIAARLYVSDAVRCTLWLTADTLVPVTAELSEDGRRIMSCDFSDWTAAPPETDGAIG